MLSCHFSSLVSVEKHLLMLKGSSYTGGSSPIVFTRVPAPCERVASLL